MRPCAEEQGKSGFHRLTSPAWISFHQPSVCACVLGIDKRGGAGPVPKHAGLHSCVQDYRRHRSSTHCKQVLFSLPHPSHPALATMAPTVVLSKRQDCYRDTFGRTRCSSFSNGARIGTGE